MENANPVGTPVETGIDLRKPLTEAEILRNIPYRELVGSIMYPMVIYRPDLAHVCGLLSRFCSCPTEAAWRLAKRVLRYLKGTKNLGLVLGGTEGPILHGYVDADYAEDKNDRTSISGNALMMKGGTIQWLSKKQPCPALSTMEAEYVAAGVTAQDLTGLKNQLSELGIDCGTGIILREDNQSCIDISNKAASNKRVKHIDIKFHYIRHKVRDGTIRLEKVASEDNIADIFTKPLPKPRFEKLREDLGMRTICERGEKREEGELKSMI
jgi:hypothetical protein